MAGTRKKTATSSSREVDTPGRKANPAAAKTQNKVETGKSGSKKTAVAKKPAGKGKAKNPKSAKADSKPEKRSFLSRLKRWALIAIVVIIAWPVVMTLVYKIPFIRPISNLMVYEALFGDGAKRQWLYLEDISPNLRRSIIMSEDGQFCSHYGVDLGALKEVAEDAIGGKPTRGASTITMQLAKNLFLWNGRSYIRKGLEIPLAIWLDFVLGKKRVMEIYLNIAEWDTGKFGVEEAAQTYFGISAGDMSKRQAALLAVTLPNPKGRNAAKPTRSMNRVANIVQRRAQGGQYFVQCVFEQ